MTAGPVTDQGSGIRAPEPLDPVGPGTLDLVDHARAWPTRFMAVSSVDPCMRLLGAVKAHQCFDLVSMAVYGGELRSLVSIGPDPGLVTGPPPSPRDHGWDLMALVSESRDQ